MNKYSGLLLYQTVIDDLSRKIDDGFFAPGAQIPTEKQLCEEYGVSRITVRRAVEELVKGKKLDIVRGKGTFVRRAVPQKIELLDISGFADSAKGQDPYRKIVLQQRAVSAGAELGSVFSLPEQAELLLYARAIYTQNLPFSIDYAYFPLAYYPDLEQQLAICPSTFRMLKEVYGIQFCSAHKEIRYADYASAKSEFADVHLLKEAAYHGLAIVRRSICDQKGRVVHFSKYCLPADQVSFFIDIKKA